MLRIISTFSILILFGTPSFARPPATGSQRLSAELSLDSAREMLASGNLEGAQKGMESLLAGEEKAHGRESLEVATALSRLAMLDAAGGEGRLNDAQKLYERALQIREVQLGRNSLGVARSLENLARIHVAFGSDPDPQYFGHLAIARRLLKRAMWIRRSRLSAFNPGMAVASYNLALQVTWRALPTARAFKLYKQALAIREKAFGPESLPTADSLLKLAGLVERKLGSKPSNPNYPSKQIAWCRQAKEVYDWRERALAIKEKRLGSDALDLRPILEQLAGTPCTETGRPDNRLLLLKRIAAIDEKASGAGSTVVAGDLVRLLPLLSSPGDYPEKKAVALRAVAIREAHLDADACHNEPFPATKWEPLVAQFDDQDRLDGIEEIDDALLDLASFHELASSRRQPVFNYNEAASTYEEYGDYVSAERVLRADILARSSGPTAAAEAYWHLAAFLARRGRLAEAGPAFQQALAEQMTGIKAQPDNVYSRNSYYEIIDEYVALLRKQKAADQALMLLKQSLALEEAAGKPTIPNRIGRLDALGDFYSSENRYVEAETAFREAVRVQEMDAGERPPTGNGDMRRDSATARFNEERLLAQLDRLGDFYRLKMHRDEAKAVYHRALTIELSRYDGHEIGPAGASVNLGGPQKPPIVDRLERFASFLRDIGETHEADEQHKRALLIWSISLEQELRDAAAILKLGDHETSDWYNLPRWKPLVAIYRDLGEDDKAKRTASLVSAAIVRMK